MLSMTVSYEYALSDDGENNSQVFQKNFLSYKQYFKKHNEKELLKY